MRVKNSSTLSLDDSAELTNISLMYDRMFSFEFISSSETESIPFDLDKSSIRSSNDLVVSLDLSREPERSRRALTSHLDDFAFLPAFL